MLRIVVVTVVFAPRRTTSIVLNSRDDVSHIVPFLNSWLHPENILLTKVLWDPRDNREYMTQFVSETFNVLFMFVTSKTAMSLSLLWTHDGHPAHQFSCLSWSERVHGVVPQISSQLRSRLTIWRGVTDMFFQLTAQSIVLFRSWSTAKSCPLGLSERNFRRRADFRTRGAL